MTSDVFDRVRSALPGYEIGGEIARGGFGVVLFGTHQRLQRKVAVKLLPSEVAHDVDIRRRFAAEARLMAAIDHPHVVPIYDYVEDEELCLFVMEYLPAGTVLSRFLSQGFSPGPAIGVALACSSALEAAHRQGVLHRDVKPANLMFAANGTVKLSDFGIAKIVGGESGKTRAGDVLGTAYYIAPEQVLGTPVTPSTDVYALAITLYQLLSGTLPFPTEVDSTALYMMHAYSRPTPLIKTAPKLPPQICDVVMRGLTTDPRARWQSAEEFGVALASTATRCWGQNWLAQSGVPVLGNESIAAATAAISVPATASMNSWPPGLGPTQQDVSPVGERESPRVPYIVAGALTAVAVLLALVGLGSPPRGGDLMPGTVTIAGVDPVTADGVTIDMTKPIVVTVNGVDGDIAALDQMILGGGISASDGRIFVEGDEGTAELDPPNPYIVAGRTTGELTISDGEKRIASYRFGLRSTQSAWTTALAGGVLFIALFAVAYVESFSRTLRRGRREMSARVGLPIAAAFLAVAMVGVVWIAAGREPTPATLAVCVLLGVGAGVSLSIAAMRHGVANRNPRSGEGSRPTGPHSRPVAASRSKPQHPKRAAPSPPPGAKPPSADSGTSGARRRIKGIKIQRD